MQSHALPPQSPVAVLDRSRQKFRAQKRWLLPEIDPVPPEFDLYHVEARIRPLSDAWVYRIFPGPFQAR